MTNDLARATFAVGTGIALMLSPTVLPKGLADWQVFFIEILVGIGILFFMGGMIGYGKYLNRDKYFKQLNWERKLLYFLGDSPKMQ